MRFVEHRDGEQKRRSAVHTRVAKRPDRGASSYDIKDFFGERFAPVVQDEGGLSDEPCTLAVTYLNSPDVTVLRITALYPTIQPMFWSAKAIALMPSVVGHA